MNLTLKPADGFSSILSVIVTTSMMIDHVALYPMKHGIILYETMRCIGRIAFPVFAFLIAEGFIHTRNWYRYFFTLLGFTVISEVPWYLLNGADGSHNVMFILALGVATLIVPLEFTLYAFHPVPFLLYIVLIVRKFLNVYPLYIWTEP